MTLGGRDTLHAGLRWDRQRPRALESFAGPHPFFGDNLPSGELGEPSFTWESFSPRASWTRSLGSERKSLLRASYARTHAELGIRIFAALPASTGAFRWFDDGDLELEVDEVSELYAKRIWRRDFDASLSPPVTDELRLGSEYSILPELVVGIGLVARETRDRLHEELWIATSEGLEVAAAEHYELAGSVQGLHPDGTLYSREVYRLREGLRAEGTRLRNGEGREHYRGASLTLVKRLSNRWMARGHLTYGDWQEKTEKTADPTPTFLSSAGDERWQGSADRGSKSEVWMRSSWSFDLAGMLQIAPDRWWGFNVAGHVLGRDGYGLPYRTFVSGFGDLTGDGIDREVLVSRDEKLDDLFILDLSLEKEIVFWDFAAVLGIEVSNVFDQRTVQQREGQLVSSAFRSDEGDFAREVVVPHTIQWSLRLSYN